ncbi:dolichol-phosphate mannosyltransferase subunit 1, partial [Olea europaea subsp. europaea]
MKYKKFLLKLATQQLPPSLQSHAYHPKLLDNRLKICNQGLLSVINRRLDGLVSARLQLQSLDSHSLRQSASAESARTPPFAARLRRSSVAGVVAYVLNVAWIDGSTGFGKPFIDAVWSISESPKDELKSNKRRFILHCLRILLFQIVEELVFNSLGTGATKETDETGTSIVTGTRFVKGGGLHGWNLMSKLTSRGEQLINGTCFTYKLLIIIVG